MSSLFLFFGIISFLVIIHELGHFLVARKFGIKVEEFGLGLPPKLFGKKFGDTEYTFNALPFGGFVRLKGEEVTNQDPDSFEAKPAYQRALVIIAGVTMNLILGIVIFQSILMMRDYKSDYFPIINNIKPDLGKLEVTSGLVAGISEDSKLDKSFIKGGDYIYSVNQVVITSNSQLRDIISSSNSDSVNLVVKNIKDRSSIKEFNVNLVEKDGKKRLGIFLGEAGRVVYEGNDRYIAGALHSYNIIKLSLNSIGMLFSQAVATKDISVISENVDGPIGIYSVVDSINQNNSSLINFDILNLVALLSLSLAVMNILPIPAVDGGRLVFIVYEIVRRKKVNPNFELAVNKYGMLFLLGMLILVTFKDLSQILIK